MTYAFPGAEYISDTAAHTGRFGKVVALEDSVIGTLVATHITGNNLTSMPLKQNCSIEGVITSVTLSSGSVIAYRL
jgi:hypothetical protein